jgi:hypothetical protein
MNLQNQKAAQHSVHPTGGSRPVFKQFAWLGVGSVKAALSRPAHQRVTQAISHFGFIKNKIPVVFTAQQKMP